jgi:hypothetical protein
MSKEIKWRIYYDDGSTFTNLDGMPWEAPGLGVVCIVQLDPNPVEYNINTQALREATFYWYHRKWGYWLPSDIYGMLDQLTHDQKDWVCAVRFGRWAEHTLYREILEQAENDLDFPPKSGNSKSERSEF